MRDDDELHAIDSRVVGTTLLSMYMLSTWLTREMAPNQNQRTTSHDRESTSSQGLGLGVSGSKDHVLVGFHTIRLD